MRVFVVSRWYPSADDPLAGVFVQDQVRALGEVCAVHVFVPRASALGAALRFVVRRGDLVAEQVVPTVRIRFGFLLRWLAFERAFAGAAKTGDGETVVHVHLLLPDALPVLLAAHRRGWPVVVTEHVSFLDELLRSRRGRRQVRMVLRYADAVLPVSDKLARQLVVLEPRARLRKIANPVDTSRFAPSERAPRDYAISVAIRLGEAKGTDVLLRAWASAGARAALPPLVLVGDGPDRVRFERLAADLGLDGACRFVGLLGRTELADLVGGAAFLVSASRDENVAGVVTEAIASGTPVVSTRVGEPAAYVTADVGLLVDPGNVEQLANAVVEMAAHHGAYEPASLHAYMRDLHGHDRVRGQLLELYREVLARRSDARSVEDRLP